MFAELGQFSLNMTCWLNVVLMLGHRLRRWPNIKTTLRERVMFAVMPPWCK